LTYKERNGQGCARAQRAAPSDWCGPQRSEDTGQTGLSLEQNGRVAMRREKAAPKADRPALANDMEQYE